MRTRGRTLLVAFLVAGALLTEARWVRSVLVRPHRLAASDFVWFYYPFARSAVRCGPSGWRETCGPVVEEIRGAWRTDPERRPTSPAALQSFFLPFGLLPPRAAFFAYVALGHLLLLAAAAALAAVLRRATGRGPPVALLFAGLLATNGAFADLLRGQTAIAVFACLVGAAAAAGAGRRAAAGLLLALALLPKLYLLPFALVVLSCTGAAAWGGFAAAVLLLAALGLLVDPTSAWLSTIAGHYRMANPAAAAAAPPFYLWDVGTLGVVHRLFVSWPMTRPWLDLGRFAPHLYVAFAAGVAAATAWRFRRAPRDAAGWPATWLSLLPALLLAFPSIGAYHYLWCAPAFLIALSRASSEEPLGARRATLWVLLALLLAGDFSVLRKPDLTGGVLWPVPPPEWVGLLALWIVTLVQAPRPFPVTAAAVENRA